MQDHGDWFLGQVTSLDPVVRRAGVLASLGISPAACVPLFILGSVDHDLAQVVCQSLNQLQISVQTENEDFRCICLKTIRSTLQSRHSHRAALLVARRINPAPVELVDTLLRLLDTPDEDTWHLGELLGAIVLASDDTTLFAHLASRLRHPDGEVAAVAAAALKKRANWISRFTELTEEGSTRNDATALMPQLERGHTCCSDPTSLQAVYGSHYDDYQWEPRTAFDYFWRALAGNYVYQSPKLWARDDFAECVAADPIFSRAVLEKTMTMCKSEWAVAWSLVGFTALAVLPDTEVVLRRARYNAYKCESPIIADALECLGELYPRLISYAVLPSTHSKTVAPAHFADVERFAMKRKDIDRILARIEWKYRSDNRIDEFDAVQEAFVHMLLEPRVVECIQRKCPDFPKVLSDKAISYLCKVAERRAIDVYGRPAQEQWERQIGTIDAIHNEIYAQDDPRVEDTSLLATMLQGLGIRERLVAICRISFEMPKEKIATMLKLSRQEVESSLREWRRFVTECHDLSSSDDPP
jgi:hypothetical protein